MNDTVLILSSTMSDKHDRLYQLKTHVNQLILEIQSLDPSENLLPLFNLNKNSNDKYVFQCSCPYISSSSSSRPMILHSTTYDDYKKCSDQRKKPCLLTPKKNLLTFTCTTSTPKKSVQEKIFHQKFHFTSTPRRKKSITLKRLLYNQAHPNKKLLVPIDDNPQWI